jgi:SNF2 family DNA or RNA helicase
VNFVKAKTHRLNPVLVIAPLSTLGHWRREFEAWTDLNVTVYHGSAEDRRLIRESEFVYESDRPVGGVAFNQTYLKKCVPKRSDDSSSPWMVQVVITTPEMITSEDSAELAAVPWEIVVCDEAHRMKNNSSKLTTRMKDGAFKFNHKVLLTGTPIQNDVTEFWTLLNFIDPEGFDDIGSFLDQYGDLKTKESIDELHEEIRPYILRRLKEDVETSVPPKEETIIEVELTADQKKYYRALYEKNVKFLYKGKTSAVDGPSLLNLAMQLRKCCNHLFLLNGVEEDFRASLTGSSERLAEVDILVRASGKLVLLDKLLPRLQKEGHRVLLFSQFKIMLDVLEDYLHERDMKFERVRVDHRFPVCFHFTL